MTHRFTLPLHVNLKRKTKKDVRLSVNLNTFRAMHHRTYTEAKIEYARVMGEQLNKFDPLTGKMHVHYDYYAAMNNNPDLDNFDLSGYACDSVEIDCPECEEPFNVGWYATAEVR